MAPRRAQQKREVLAFAHPGKHESSIVTGNCWHPIGLPLRSRLPNSPSVGFDSPVGLPVKMQQVLGTVHFR